MFLDFIKKILGLKESFDESLIGLAKFEYQEVEAYDKAPKKKKPHKTEVPLSQMLRRM